VTRGGQRYPHLFSPVSLGPVELKNRFYLSPHGNPTWILSHNNGPTEDFVAYFEERAAAEVALLFHGLPISPIHHPYRQCAYSNETIPAFAAVAEAVHAHGGKIFAQLAISNHAGTMRWESGGPRAPSVGPSANAEYRWPTVAHEMAIREIRAAIALWVRSVTNLSRAGYDGFELHATHGLLVEQFLSPYFNKRNDAYGGSLSNRLRFLTEILAAMREAAGLGRALGIRLNCDEHVHGGHGTEEQSAVLEEIATGGLIDFVDLDMALGAC
jgi:2,4-dienoyl-CoA reductase-like NADH-dependent reductase (Old Yellow Enzyme family)